MPTASPWITRLRRSPVPLAAALACAISAPAGAQPAGEGWPMAGRDARHSGIADGPAPPYRRAWTARLEGRGPFSGPVVSGGVVVVVGRESVVALEAASGEVRWEADREEGPAGSAAVAGDLVIHSTGQDDTAAVVARRIEGGREEWSTPSGGAVPGGITVQGQRAFVGTRAGEVLALDVATGRVEWRFETAGVVGTTPAVAEGLVLVTARSSTGSSALQAIDAGSGEESWRLAPEGGAAPQPSSPAAGSGVVVAGLGDGRIHAAGLGSGAERWSVGTRVGFGSDQTPALPEEDQAGREVADLYFSQALRLSRLDPATGEERWTYQLPSAMPDASPSLSGSHVLIGDATGLAAAIDVASGLLVWKESLGPGPIGSFAVTPDRLFVASGGEEAIVVSLEHDPEGTLLQEESPTVLDPVRAALNYVGAVLALGVLLLLLFRGPRLIRSRSEEVS